MSEQPNDPGQRPRLLGQCQRDRPPGASGAPGSPDPVDVILGVDRHVEVEYVGHLGQIEAARGHVGADQQLELAVLEPCQGVRAHRLGHVAVERRDREFVLLERAEQDVHVALAVAEDERALDRLGADQRAQRGALVLALAGDLDQRLHHGIGRRARRVDRDLLGVHQEGVGQAPDLRRHGGGEEHGLTDLRQQADDALDVGNEAHVEHAVGLVDDQDLHAGEQDPAALEQVEQAARGRDQHVDAALQLPLLLGDRRAADQERLGERVVLAVDLEALGDLGGQLARRLQDQRAGHARPGAAAGQDVDHGEREGRRLAGAGLGATEQVAAHEHIGDGFFLDRCGLGITGFFHRLEDLGAEAQICEFHVSPYNRIMQLNSVITTGFYLNSPNKMSMVSVKEI